MNKDFNKITLDKKITDAYHNIEFTQTSNDKICNEIFSRSKIQHKNTISFNSNHLFIPVFATLCTMIIIITIALINGPKKVNIDDNIAAYTSEPLSSDSNPNTNTSNDTVDNLNLLPNSSYKIANRDNYKNYQEIKKHNSTIIIIIETVIVIIIMLIIYFIFFYKTGFKLSSFKSKIIAGLFMIMLTLSLITAYKFLIPKDKINSFSVSLNIFDTKFDSTKMVNALTNREFPYYHINGDFKFNNIEVEHQTPFTAYYQITFDASLRSSLKSAQYEINYSDAANEICVCDESPIAWGNPFESTSRQDNKDGVYLILVDGIQNDKTEAEILNILKKNTVTLYIEYNDGRLEKHEISFDNTSSKTNHFNGITDKSNTFISKWSID